MILTGTGIPKIGRFWPGPGFCRDPGRSLVSFLYMYVLGFNAAVLRPFLAEFAHMASIMSIVLNHVLLEWTFDIQALEDART